jgi:hypothetical protein
MRTESESKRPIPENFAQNSTSEIFAFNFQKVLCENFVNSLKTRLQLTAANKLPMGHLLVSGSNFGGKSTLMQLIANLLFDEMRIFASRIDCNEFKGTLFRSFNSNEFLGKSPDSIGTLLDARLKVLRIRTPALLLLDNFDFLNSQVEDEDRRRFISKVYTSKFLLVCKFYFLI